MIGDFYFAFPPISPAILILNNRRFEAVGMPTPDTLPLPIKPPLGNVDQRHYRQVQGEAPSLAPGRTTRCTPVLERDHSDTTREYLKQRPMIIMAKTKIYMFNPGSARHTTFVTRNYRARNISAGTR